MYDTMCHIRDTRHVTISQIIRQGIDMFLKRDHQVDDPPKKTLTDEHRAEISASQKARILTPEFTVKREATKRRKHDEQRATQTIPLV